MNTIVGITFLCTLIRGIASKSDAFTSIHDIKQILHKERVLTRYLNLAIEAEKERLGELEGMRDSMKMKLLNLNISSMDDYVGNPLNALHTIRRFTADWNEITNTLNTTRVQEFFNEWDRNVKLPTLEDQKGAVSGILRLQNFYKINTRNVSRGFLSSTNPISKTEEIGVGLMWAMGYEAFKQKEWFLMKEWLDLALERIGDLEQSDGCKRSWIVDFLSYAEFQLGDYERSLDLAYQCLEYSPDDQKHHNNIEQCKKKISKGRKKSSTKPVEQLRYQLCRGEGMRKPTIDEELQMVCWYKNDQPILRYKPQKVERLWARPEIVMFRELLNDEQTGTLIDLSLQKLVRAGLNGQDVTSEKYTNSRVAKHAWLSMKESPIIRNMGKRAQAMTNLNMKYAEHLQIANYGIGGHYDAHYDYQTGENVFPDLKTGNRIATLMYYLSDVEAGGGTAFTFGKTTVYPSKGDAVFWWNLKQNGKVDESSKHAGCPVLMGQKWIANWWIHEYGQEFRRPCPLDKTL
ncbi:prolyl 4-hydroxylase subunit alpha-2-like [Clytia hemisphaerica]|uniref:procollagen-proline 4-dioxygenase n=1 Tax=Clytia hemisphaerica TaxID=252671 RepID=A0A7M5V6L9_9CNID